MKEPVNNSPGAYYRMGTRQERQLIGRWLEEQVESRTNSEELLKLLHTTIECLKRGVFPDQL
jgi:hypothetical protein